MEIHDAVFDFILIMFIISVKACNRTWGSAIQGIEPGKNVYSYE